MKTATRRLTPPHLSFVSGGSKNFASCLSYVFIQCNVRYITLIFRALLKVNYWDHKGQKTGSFWIGKCYSSLSIHNLSDRKTNKVNTHPATKINRHILMNTFTIELQKLHLPTGKSDYHLPWSAITLCKDNKNHLNNKVTSSKEQVSILHTIQTCLDNGYDRQ